MLKILLVRHGHVDGIDPERFRGREPLELSERGRAEAAAVARRIAAAWRPSRIYTSPMGRCLRTADEIAKACGITAAARAELNDIDYGAWQFKTFEDARAENPALFAAWFATPQLVRFPRGESLQEVAARWADFLRDILAHHTDDAIVVVGHDSVNRVSLLQFLDLPLASYWRIAQNPCCVNEIDIVDGKTCVLRVNETYHLNGIS